MNSQPPDRPEAPTAKANGNRPIYSFSQSSPAILRLWLGGNALGFAIATIILVSVSALISATPLGMGGIEALIASEIVVGSCVGTLQALILKRQISRLRVWQWILASIFGGYLGIFLWAIAMLGVAAVPGIAASIRGLNIVLLTASIFGAMLGVTVGLGQVLVVAQHVHGLRRWWLANVVGRSLGWLCAVGFGLFFNTRPVLIPLDSNIGDSISALLICGGIGGLIYGGVTALALPSLTPRQRAIPDKLN
ncbi:MAG: hypothetical protein ACFB0G_20165 [Leptolyngbyaceae cyanobacterium]